MSVPDVQAARQEDVAELLARFDVFDDAHFARMNEVMAHARQQCPVAHTTADGGLHLVTTYDEVRQVLGDPVTFSSKEASPRPTPIGLPPLTVDAPLHNDFRKVIQRFFTRPYLRKYEENMREIARDCIAGFVEKGSFDVVSEFALPYTSATTAKVVFDEDDRTKMDAAAAAVERVARENSPEAYQGVAELAAQYMQERASSAAHSDDLISAVVSGRVGGRPMTPEEQIGMVTVLFIGALDTTRAEPVPRAATAKPGLDPPRPRRVPALRVARTGATAPRHAEVLPGRGRAGGGRHRDDDVRLREPG
jgi:cytochrome P450